MRRQASRRAAQRLVRLARSRQARFVAIYLGLAAELGTAEAIAALRAAGCEIFVPKLRGDALRFTRYRPGTPLRRNRFRIAEPVTTLLPPRLDLIVLPLVAFDAKGRRLGMGGGFYDRLLARPRAHRRPLRVGYAFAAQQVATVPVAAHDATLDAVVTERATWRFR